MNREQFEAFISAPPYERDITRSGPGGAWPGQYRSYHTQLAWEVLAEVVAAMGLPALTSADAFRQWAERFARALESNQEDKQ